MTFCKAWNTPTSNKITKFISLCDKSLQHITASSRLLCVGNGYPTNKFISQKGLYLKLVYCCFFLITEFFSSLFRSHTKERSCYTVLQSKVQCSKEIVFQLIMLMVILSCHVMSRFRHLHCSCNKSLVLISLLRYVIQIQTSLRDKILLQGQRFSRHKAICCSNLLRRCVAAIRRIVSWP